MGPFNLLMTRSTTFTEEEMVILGGAVMLVGFIYLLSFVFMVIMFFVNAIPYFIMGRKAGFKHAWLAFIPFGQNYVAMTLPHREFNIFNKFKTTNRKKAFWAYVITWGIWLATAIINEITSWISSYMSELEITDMSTGGMLGMLIGMLVLLAVSLVILAVTMVNSFAMIMIRWRTYYDLLLTYREPQHAMWASIVSLFFPIVMTVFTYMIMNKTPEYGFGNYYATEIIPNKPQNSSGNPHTTVTGSNAPATQPNKLADEVADTEEKLPSSALAIASFVCGIVSLVSVGCVPFSGLASLICGFVGKGKYPTYTTEYKRCRQGIVMSLVSYGIGMLLGVICTVGWMIYVFG